MLGGRKCRPYVVCCPAQVHGVTPGAGLLKAFEFENELSFFHKDHQLGVAIGDDTCPCYIFRIRLAFTPFSAVMV